MQFDCNMASFGWFCGLIRRKEMSFIVLLLRLGLVGFSRVCRVSRARVGISVSVSLVLVTGWDMTSRRGMSGVTCRVPVV